jgi:RNA methyltransferase, TrmH family
MLSKAQIKYIRSLTQQKYRKEHNVFIAEGDKISKEWLNSRSTIRLIIAFDAWLMEHQQEIAKHPEAEVHTVNDSVLASISTLQTPNKVILVVSIPSQERELPKDEWAIGLDGVQDPGNMGTIIRIADWFGIENLICSPDCVDIYNPKVVQSAMGGHLRINFYETELATYISSLSMPVIATTLQGQNLYTTTPFDKAILLIGNEGKGLSKDLLEKATHKVTIPRRGGAESLNAAVSTGIFCSYLLPH